MIMHRNMHKYARKYTSIIKRDYQENTILNTRRKSLGLLTNASQSFTPVTKGTSLDRDRKWLLVRCHLASPWRFPTLRNPKLFE